MARDSLFGETILWSGRPKVTSVPLTYRLVAVVGAVVSIVALCFALVVSVGLHARVGSMVFFSAWCATIALGAWRLPLVWRARVEYILTDKHVIWRRGPIRRSIERGAISYARIQWSERFSGVGDLVLVRAVPTGALRRTLSLTLVDVEAPDRLWALVRGIEPSAPLGDGDRPLAQRLDDGERVLWTAIPLASPWSVRRIATALLALVLAAASVHMVLRAVPTVRQIFGVHALGPVMLAVLVVGMALGASVLIAVALGVGYAAWLRPLRLARATRYFVTNRRVLIRRANEELHLDRARIAYVIDAPWRRLHDVFLVLDGPQARALAPSGAFGAYGDDGKLAPVLSAIEDAETVGAILRSDPRVEAIRDAA
jgi:hypothetical protein